MTATPSDTSEPSEEQKNENEELAPYWKAQLSKSTAPGRVYYFNYKNRCAVWRLEETKLKKNNFMPKDAHKERVEPIEPLESPDDQVRLETRHDQTERGSDEQGARSAQEIQAKSTAVNSNPWGAPMLMNPNIWSVPPGNGQPNNPLSMTMFANNMLPNLPNYGPIPGYSGWGYPYQNPFPPPGFPVNGPNITPFQFGGQANLAKSFPHSVMFGGSHTSNPIAHSSHSIPVSSPSAVSSGPNLTVVDGRQLQSEHGEYGSPERTIDLEAQPKRVRFENKPNPANRLQQQKSLPADDLRLKLKELHRKRRLSSDKIEESNQTLPLVRRERRLSCPGTVEMLVEDPDPQSTLSADESNEDQEEVPTPKGESYGCWLLKAAKPGVSTDLCYIAVDTNVYLTDLDLIKSLIDSDTDKVCRILVPWRVNNELGNLCKNKKKNWLVAVRIRSSKANSFIRDELSRPDCAMVVQSPVEASKKLIDCYGPDDEIVNCCLQYAEKNLHVILLSDDKNLATKVLSSGIDPYTREEIKMFMEDTKERVKEKMLLSRVKILVPNTLAMQENAELSASTQISDSSVDQNPVHTTKTNVPVQSPIVANFQIPPPIIVPVSFNPSIPPPPRYVIPNKPMFINIQSRVAPNIASVPWDTFTTNMMSTLANEERGNNADTTSLASSKSSTKNSKKLAMQAPENKTAINTDISSNEDKSQKTSSKFVKKVVWEEPSHESKTEKPAVKNNKIILRRTRWNNTGGPSASTAELTTLKNLPNVPIFSRTELVASDPVTIPTTAITSSSLFSNNTNNIRVKHAIQSNVKEIERIKPPSQVKIPVEAQKTKPVLKPDMWVSKRTQQMVMDSQNMSHTEDTKSAQEPIENDYVLEKRLMQDKINLTPIRSNEVVASNVCDVPTDRILAKRLLRRMDEWTCILVQTMEDVLSVILQQELCGLPPPWSIHEAASAVMHQFRRSNKQASAIGGRLAMELNSASRTTIQGGIQFLTPFPSTAHQYMKIHGSCIQLLAVLKESKQNPELKIAEQTLSGLVDEIKKGEIDVLFDNLDATQENRDEKLDKPIDNENEDDEDFIKNRYQDVDVNAEILGYLKKHYIEWSQYQENNAQNESKENKKGNKGLKAQRFVASAFQPNAGKDIHEIRLGNNANEEVTQREVLNNEVNSKKIHTPATEKVSVSIIEPRIIRNLNLIPEFEARCNINNELEEWELDDDGGVDDEGVDDGEYYEDMEYEQDNEGWDEEMEYNADGYDIDRNVENEGKAIENIQLQGTHLQEKMKGQKVCFANQNKRQNAENVVDENIAVIKKNMKMSENIEMVPANKEMFEENTEKFEKNTEMIKTNTEKTEKNNNIDPIQLENVDKTRPFIDKKKQHFNNVAVALRLSFLNVLAYTVEQCGDLNKKELSPIILEGDSSGLPGAEELPCHVDSLVNKLTGLVEGGRCDARELRDCLRRLAPRLSLPGAGDVLTVCKIFDKGKLLSALENMKQLQLLLKILSSGQKQQRD